MARRPNPLPPAATLHGSADDVEAQFYEALQHADIERLMAVWADEDEIVCVHPGGGRAIGAGAIRATFEAIFANGGLAVRPEQVHRLVHIGSALHHLVERIDIKTEQGPQSAWVMATNLYVKTAQGWRLVSHHASPGTPHPPPELGGDMPTQPATLH